MERRGFLLGLAGVLAAPAIVRAGLLMPVSTKLLKPKSLLVLPIAAGRDQFGELNTLWFNVFAAHIDYVPLHSMIHVNGEPFRVVDIGPPNERRIVRVQASKHSPAIYGELYPPARAGGGIAAA